MREKGYAFWWNDGTGDDAEMERSHRSLWRDVVEAMEERNLAEKRVLDFGCDQGAFLRHLYDARPFKIGVGIDLAGKAIERAEATKGDRPLRYVHTGRPDEMSGPKFDVAFSCCVIYLIADLEAHATIVNRSLASGGVYYATYTDYNGCPDLPAIFKQIGRNGATPMQLHSLDHIAGAFWKKGFVVQVRRLAPVGFVELNRDERWFANASARLDCEYGHRYVFRFIKTKELL